MTITERLHYALPPTGRPTLLASMPYIAGTARCTQHTAVPRRLYPTAHSRPAAAAASRVPSVRLSHFYGKHAPVKLLCSQIVNGYVIVGCAARPVQPSNKFCVKSELQVPPQLPW